MFRRCRVLTAVFLLSAGLFGVSSVVSPEVVRAALRPGDTWTGTVTLKGSWQENCNQTNQYETDVCSDQGSSSISAPVTGVLEALSSPSFRLNLNGSGQATYHNVNHFDRTLNGTDCEMFHNNTDFTYDGSGSSALSEIQLTFEPDTTARTFLYQMPVLNGQGIDVTETDSYYTDYYPPANTGILGDCTQQPSTEQSTQSETSAGYPYPQGPELPSSTPMESFSDNPYGPTMVDGSFSWSQTIPVQNGPTPTETYTYTETWSLSGPPCPGALSATRGPAAGRGQATLLEASTCGLTITSPPANQTIAMTDDHYLNPQPGPADRQPKQRKLTVKGTAPTQSVTLNGQQVPVMGGDWEAQLPIGKPGPLTLTASDGRDNVQQKDTLIDVVITDPTEGQMEFVTATPQMPALNATVRVEGYSGDTKSVHFLWTLQVQGQFVNKAGYHAYVKTPATGATMGAATVWKPNYTMMVGGVARLSIVATGLPTIRNPVLSEPRWFDIPGKNPFKATIMAFTKAKDAANANTLDHLFCHESNFQQFNPDVEPREPATPDIPADWAHNPGPFRPLSGSQKEDFGADIGVAQANPAKFPNQQWNWHDNVERGIAVLHDGIQAAGEWRPQEQARLDSERQTALDQANRARKLLGLQPVNIDRIIVPPLSPEQLKRFAIRKYNGGEEYRFREHFVEVVTPDGPVVQAQGTRDWVEQAGDWEAEGAWQARGGVLQVRRWIPKNNPGYVDAVVNCQV